MIFCWFLREKKLISENFFAARTAESLLRDWFAKDCDQDTQGRFYKAILQNLFFATLGTAVEERQFRSARSYQGKNKHYGDQRYFRHLGLFIDKAPVEELYKSIPFLNGGLFENLDEIPGRDRDFDEKECRVDGFSDITSKQPTVPDFSSSAKNDPSQSLQRCWVKLLHQKHAASSTFSETTNSPSKKIPRLRKTSPSIPSCSDALLKTF
jgi:hypothetical protein